jgi:hypothetical protein
MMNRSIGRMLFSAHHKLVCIAITSGRRIGLASFPGKILLGLSVVCSQRIISGVRSPTKRSPKYLKYQRVWPRFRVIFSAEPERLTGVSKRLTFRKSSKQFSASLPASTMGLPKYLSTADDDGACECESDLVFAFDFSRPDQGPSKHAITRRASSLLLAYADLRRQWSANFAGSLDDELGVTVDLR